MSRASEDLGRSPSRGVDQPLAHDRVVAAGASPTRWAVFLHGILGTRANWRAIARQVVRARPTLGALLVDLREHGGSRGYPPPHDLRAAADDVTRTLTAANLDARMIVGHSFGGKVALTLHAGGTSGAAAFAIIDSNPGLAPEGGSLPSSLRVLTLLDTLPRTWPSRDAFIARCTDAGLSQPLAAWLAMNVERQEDGGFLLAVDTGAVRALITSHASTDLWAAVEAESPARVELVIGGRSGNFAQADLARLEACSERTGTRVSGHVIADAGHWVHTDAPAALVERLLAILDAVD